MLTAIMSLGTSNLAFADWPQVFGDSKMTTAMLDRLEGLRGNIVAGQNARPTWL